MADWFAQNAPASAPQPPQGGDWFAANAPQSKLGLLDRLQSSFDAQTKTSPSEPLMQTGIKSVMSGIGTPFVHPMDTLSGLGHMIAHPIDQAHQEVDQLYQDKAQGGVGYAATKMAGQAFGGIALGDIGGAGIQAAAKAVIPNVIPVASRVALLGKTPAGAYESAMKISPAVSAVDRASMVQTGLDNALPVSKAGAEKLADRIDTLNQAIKDQIASDPNRPIDPNAVATRADQIKGRFANQVNASGDLSAIDASKQQFLKEQGAPTDSSGNVIGPAPDMTAANAQAMKQGTYSVLKGKFGEQGSAAVEAQKSLARGLKEEIATQFPELSKLNAQESSLLELQPALERAVNRISNHQVIGIGTPVAGAAAKAVSGSSVVGGVAMTLKAVLDNPAVKSRLAIALSKANKIPITSAMDRIQVYSRALGPSVAATQGYSSGDNPSQSTQ